MSKKRHLAADEPHFFARTMRLAMRDGQAIEPHAHDWHQLIYAAAGVMTVTADRGLWIVPPQWAIWAPSGVRHAIRFSGASSFATLYLRPSDWSDLPAASCVVSVSPLLRALILRACEEGMLDRRDAVQQATATLIVDCFRTQSVPALGLPAPTSEVLRRVAEACVHDDAGSAEIARRFGLGVRTLERRFLAETGMAFGQWRRQARFLEALKLLAQGAPVKQVAAATGYRSASAFVAAFGETFQTTPGRYFETRT
ncbi:MAG: helix-turn-helix domain-containing protein [Alphaproteobacteria bacterium]|nr:helix-turn-helix domain-containing protein [Alphaproteobacteria bacterium]